VSLAFLEGELAALAAADLLRVPRERSPEGLVLCSNDYLGLAATATDEPVDVPVGSGAASLVTGYHAAHRAAEHALAEWIRLEATLLFSSGYAANLGVLSALAGPEDLIVSDRLNHASIIDGCRLSRARVCIFDHLDVDAAARTLELERGRVRRAFLVTESYFGMDATIADLSELRRITRRFDCALVVDEAHALGVFGDQGAGLCHAAGVEPDVLVGTLGKSVGLHGAFVGGSALLRTFLWNRARSFVFSTASSPRGAAAIPGRVELVRAADSRRADSLSLAAELRAVLARRGQTVLGEGPIVPWVLGSPGRALMAQRVLSDLGVVALAIRPPTVPPGTSRVRRAQASGCLSGSWRFTRSTSPAIGSQRRTVRSPGWARRVPDERRSGPFTRVKWARLQTCEVYRGNRARARARARLGGEKARMKGRGLGVGHVRGCPVFALRVRSRGCRDELWSHTCEAEPAIASRNAAVRTHQSRGARRGAESRGGIILGVSRETRDTGGAVASSVSGISPIVSSIGRLGGSLEGFGRGASCR
jgi:8-amino-7-oxononanoate synthase